MRFDQGDKVRVIGGDLHGEVVEVASEPGAEYGPYLVYRTEAETGRRIQTTLVVYSPEELAADEKRAMKPKFAGVTLELVEKGKPPQGTLRLAPQDLAVEDDLDDERTQREIGEAQQALAVAFAKKLITLAEYTSALAELQS